MDDIKIAKKYINKSQNAFKAGHDFELTFNDYKRLITKKLCAYSRMPLNEEYDKWDSRTLDRIDNSIGYTKENTVACAYGINQIKSMIENDNIPLDLRTLIRTAVRMEQTIKQMQGDKHGVTK